MADKITVTCPHCGSTGTHHSQFKTGEGTQNCTCPECRKSFKVYFTHGEVDAVKK